MSSRSVSIVICVYTLDRWDDIADAIVSARTQTLPPLEIIVSSTTILSCGIVSPKTFTGIDHRRQSVHPRSVRCARNTGISLARGKVVAFLDDDGLPTGIGSTR